MTPARPPLRTVPVQAPYLARRAADLVKSEDRVLLLRATPAWDGPETLSIDGDTVHVINGISQLAVLDALTVLPADHYAVVLTDRHEDDLGPAVRLRASGRRVQNVDEWAAVPGLFRGAREVARELRRHGDWVPTALLDYAPPGGWGVSPSPTLTSDVALGALLRHLLLVTDLDAAAVTVALSRGEQRARWRAVDPELQRHLADWAEKARGASTALALRLAAARDAAPVAFGLVMDVLWPQVGSAPDAQRDFVRGKFDQYLGGISGLSENARAFADLAVEVAARPGDDAGLTSIRGQATATLAELGWPEGADRSGILHEGFLSRQRSLATALEGNDPAAVEVAFRRVENHAFARQEPDATLTAAMATRLWRWLNGPAGAEPDGIRPALQDYLSDGAWVDRALLAVSAGSGDPEVARAYAHVSGAVRQRRRTQDRAVASYLTGESVAGVLGVEDVLAEVVRPWSKGSRRVLLLVLDGMSAAVATELGEELAAGLDLVEWVPEVSEETGNTGSARLSALAVLPSVTEHSRASLLSGGLRTGDLQAEKSAFRATIGGLVFHKDDLRAAAGERLPATVIEAISGNKAVVGIVINTIDDALHRQDISLERWRVDRIPQLRELVQAGVLAGRTIILTSDHGHVVEQGTVSVRAPGADGRWRSTTGAAADTGAGEVTVSGPRVLTEDGSAILLWDEARRYGRRQSGYHGGASLAELTVPVLVLQRPGLGGIPGWKQSPPQPPSWWNEPSAQALLPSGSAKTGRSRKTAQVRAVPDDGALFDIPEVADPELDAAAPADRLLATETFQQQLRRIGLKPSVDELRSYLAVLLASGGVTRIDALARAVRVPLADAREAASSLERVLNVDGYPTLRYSADRTSVLLDQVILADQFGWRADGG